MAKILVTGAKGQLGNELRKRETRLRDSVYTLIDIDELDLCDEQAVKEYFSQKDFDFVVNCAAYTAVDRAEEDEETAYKVNAGLLSNIISNIKAKGTAFIHISTDYVFDGEADSPYTESSDTNPQSAYGRTKLKGEEICLEYDNAMVIRTSWLYSSHGNNFLKTIINKGMELGELRVVDDQVGCPTFAGHLADAIITILEKVIKDPAAFKAGIYQYSNLGSCSWYEFAKEIVNLSGIECKVNPVPGTEYPTPAPRPRYSIMSKAKILDTYAPAVPHWKEGLKYCLQEMKETANFE